MASPSAMPWGIQRNDHEKLKQVARASAICTHGHRTAIAASIGAAFLVKQALDGIDPGRMIPETLAFTAGISREFETTLSRVSACLD